jgi:hypothetical protein
MNTQLLIPIIMSLIRWGLTLIGGGVALESEDDLVKASGAIAAVISFGWSIFDKYKTNKATKD